MHGYLNIPLWAHDLLTILSFLLTLAFVSAILRSRRAPGSTVAWLVVICLIPYVGIPLYLMLGGRKFKHGLSSKKRLYMPGTDPAQTPMLSPIQKILHASHVTGCKANRSLELLPTGVQAYERLIELIKNATTSIHITTFIFGNDPVGRAVVEALSERAKGGLDVRLLVDSLGATLIRHPSFTPLTDAGGKIAYFMPVLHLPFRGRANLRNHRKLMVIDGRIAVLGGMNLAQEYLGPTEDAKRWVDLGMQIEGDCVPDLAEIFRQDWAYATRTSQEATPATRTGGDVQAQVVASGPDVPGDPLYDVLLSAIFAAQHNVWIVTPYFIPDEALTKALELASKRGVQVTVIIPRQSNHRLADLSRGSFVRQLAAAGVRFGFYPRMIHAKAFMIDQTLAILGSANLDMRSLLLNYELGLVIYDKDVLSHVQRWIEERSSETESGLVTAGYWRDMAEGIGRVFGPIL